jgi:hypothetical protein
MALTINGSVGKRGAENRAVDVAAVQEALIETCDGNPNISRIPPNGSTCDPETINAIVAYQRHVLKLPFPDGIIKKGGATHNMLHMGKRWPGGANRQGTTQPAQPIPGGTPAEGDPVLEGARQEGKADPDVLKEFEDWYRGTPEKLYKGLPGFASRLDDGRKLFRLWSALRINAVALKNFGLIAKQLGRLTGDQLDLLTRALPKAGKFMKLWSLAATAAECAGLATLAIDIFIYGSQGNWGAAAGEVYKTIMNKAVPWAGMIEGLQSLTDAIIPDGPKKRLFFKVLRFLDPVGLGGSAFDSLGSLARFIMSQTPGEGERILNEAIKRLSNGPAGVLQIPGEALGDLVYYVVHAKPTYGAQQFGEHAERMDSRGLGPKW